MSAHTEHRMLGEVEVEVVFGSDTWPDGSSYAYVEDVRIGGKSLGSIADLPEIVAGWEREMTAALARRAS